MTEARYPFLTRAEVERQASMKIEPWNPAVKEELKRAARGHIRHMRSIARASGSVKARGRLQHAIHSPACRLVAAVCAWRGEPRPLRYFAQTAEDANLRRSQVGTLSVRVIPKADGSVRTISSFGHLDATKQLLLREILLAKFGYSEFEHARAGRGRDTVVGEILRSLEEGESEHLIEVDIKNCFPSVNRTELSAILNIPSSVVRNTVAIGPHTLISIRNDTDTVISEPQVRAGLPQGSRVSPLILSKLMEPMLRPFDDGMAMSYIDNIWIGAKGKVEAAAKNDALAVLLQQHPAGPFKMKYANIVTIDDYNHVLGYWVRRQTPGYSGIARVTPSPWAINAGQRKLASGLTFCQPGRGLEEALERWVLNWCKSYGAWKGNVSGQVLAYNAGYDYVWRHQRRFLIINRGRMFASFAELGETIGQHANSLALDPHYRPFGWKDKFPSLSPH